MCVCVCVCVCDMCVRVMCVTVTYVTRDVTAAAAVQCTQHKMLALDLGGPLAPLQCSTYTLYSVQYVCTKLRGHLRYVHTRTFHKHLYLHTHTHTQRQAQTYIAL